MTFCCTMIAIKNAKPPDNKQDITLMAFGVEASSYQEALGKAQAVVAHAQKVYLGYDIWHFNVNDKGEDAIITDPTRFTVIERDRT